MAGGPLSPIRRWKSRWFARVLCALLLAVPASADVIDLSTAESGVGAPDSPLALDPDAGYLEIAYWGSSNSILPQPENQAPLSVQLDREAVAVGWNMGASSGGALLVEFFDVTGLLVDEIEVDLLEGYGEYTFVPDQPFTGFSIHASHDPGGLRYQDFHYTVAFEFEQLTPANDSLHVTPPILSWSPADFDAFMVLVSCEYAGLGQRSITLRTRGTRVPVPAGVFEYITPGSVCFWRVFGLDAGSGGYAMSDIWSFQRLSAAGGEVEDTTDPDPVGDMR